MDAETPRLGQACDHHLHIEEGGRCLWRHSGMARRQLPPPSTWTLAFGGLDVTLLAHDIIRARA
jgi:hypothetical protein